jgi:hypothetical protein
VVGVSKKVLKSRIGSQRTSAIFLPPGDDFLCQ